MSPVSNSYDVVIIGAGPAGSFAAYWLVQAGLRVALIDKERFPRNKVCAGALPAKVLDILPFDVLSTIEQKFNQILLTYRLGTEFTKSYKRTLLYTISRNNFDNFLVEQAKRSGVDFLEGRNVEELKIGSEFVEILAGSETIKGEIIIGADGAHSFVAKRAALSPYDFFHIGMQIEFPIGPDSKAFSDHRNRVALDLGWIKDGYGWVFPKNNILSIGVKGPAKFAKHLRNYLFRLLRRHGLEAQNLTVKGHVIPHRTGSKPISRNKVLLVGDAAGLADFWTGEGIFYALKSSKIAAQQIIRYFNGANDALEDYGRVIEQQIMPEFRSSYLLSKAFNRISFFAFKLLKDRNYPWDLFCRVMRGDRTFLEVKKRLRPDIFIKKCRVKFIV
jgi:geranylgeranyl reductase family protein